MNKPEQTRNSQIPVLWTTADVSHFLGCSERQVYALRHEGLPSLRIGGLVRFDPERVREWLGCATREQQLRDITTSGNEGAADCAASDAFKEFPETH